MVWISLKTPRSPRLFRVGRAREQGLLRDAGPRPPRGRASAATSTLLATAAVQPSEDDQPAGRAGGHDDDGAGDQADRAVERHGYTASYAAPGCPEAVTAVAVEARRIARACAGARPAWRARKTRLPGPYPHDSFAGEGHAGSARVRMGVCARPHRVQGGR